MSVVSAYFICGSREEAERISTALVEERLAACCNILGECHSIYRWDGAVERAAEVPVIAKTRSDMADALIARVSEMHSYDNPAIVVWPIDRLPLDYARWVENNSGNGPFSDTA
ncbi:divalent-cation tolerance protein CutA [Sphingomicrobium lutaoense]|uniref:Periplasmic divalent cation tolerance protein n=1 Tax=Sphingomicrobium lutaoense TaxID=515949 RepID=A0A839YWK6_9SPHN|nr:divalent-cation tolerance protein CutA [Sphingomicrobium lutaoense]MBB3763416.1 periplasmic divalent cation tolerance protein [Sphingomicrobium lutaoense]